MSIKTEQLELLFDEAYATHSDTMFRFLVFRISDRQSALDLTQETFARYWASLLKGQKIENPRAFLFTIAGNLAKNHLRDRKKNPSLETLMEEGFDATDTTAKADELATTERIKQIFDSLPPKDSLILTLRHVKGVPVTEIAKALDMSRVAVSVRLMRLHAKLKPLFDTL